MDTVTTKLEDKDLKSVDEYLDLYLMENTGSDIKIWPVPICNIENIVADKLKKYIVDNFWLICT